MELLDWPSVRDVCRILDVTQPWVHALIKAGKLRIVRTRVGILVEPHSVELVVAQRTARTRERVPAC
jgi:hypothetical protein